MSILAYRFIALSQGMFTAVSPSQYERLNQWRWCAWKGTKGGYYAVRRDSGRVIKMHSLILECPRGKVTDHWNGDTLDNRDCNLRAISQQRNTQNTTIGRNNTPGCTGVSLTANGKWHSYITLPDGKRKNLGWFPKREDAIKARKEAEREVYGEVIREDCPPRITDWPNESLPRAKRVNGSSGIVGVHFHAQSGKWMARTFSNKRTVYLGLHPTKEAAEMVIIAASPY